MDVKNLFLILLLVVVPMELFGGTIKGKVTDEKGERLPYATIFVEGTTMGVNANGNGDYILTLAPGLYKVVCQYVGYKQTTINLSITTTDTIKHDFILKDLTREIPEVVVHANAEDPAYAIMRHAIAQRKFHQDQVSSFQTSIYLKGVARSRALPNKVMGQKVKTPELGVDSAGRGVLYLTEENADYYSDGKKYKTVIHSVHESGNKNGLGFSQLPDVISFYDNNVDLFGRESRGFISPVNDNAFLYYKFKYLGQFEENGRTINKIQVIQKRNYEPCFNGIIYIVDDEWSIHSLNLTLAKQSGMDMFDTLKVDQLYLPYQKDTWVIKSQVLYFTINLMGFDVTANFVTVYNNQKVNEPIPDSIFADKIVSSYDKTATRKDSAFWDQSRPIPLEKDETKDFVVKDSLRKVLADPKRLDSLRRRGNRFKIGNFLISGYNCNGKDYKNSFGVNSLLLGLGTDNIVNYNIVEGFNVAPKFRFRHQIDTGKNFFADAAVRYGIGNTHFNAISRFYWVMNDRSFANRFWLYGVEGGKYVFQYNADNPVLPWYNTYADLLYRINDLKLYERWQASGYVRRNYGTGLSWFVKASYEQRLPLQNTTDYSIFPGNEDGYASNTPPHLLQTATGWVKSDAALVHASISYKPGFTYTQLPDTKIANGSSWPRLTLTYDKGLPDIFNSVTNFDKWRFMIADDVRMRLLGTLKYNIGAGGFLNSAYVSIPDLMNIYGNRGIGLASPYLQSFQFAQYYEFANKEPIYGEAHVEYHLRGLLSNKIPLLRQQRWYLLVGGNAFYARQSDYYTEAFVGVDNIGWKLFRGLRVDFVQSWDSYMGRNSGIRFGLNIPGVTVNRNSPTGSEW